MAPCFSTIIQTAEDSATLFLVPTKITSTIKASFIYKLLYYSHTSDTISVWINGQLLSSLSFTGIIGAVAKDFFNIEITMEIVNQLEELERTGKKEHVVFLVKQWPADAAPSCLVSNKTEPLSRIPVFD